MHCADLEAYKKYNVVDIPYSSVPDEKEDAFESALAGMAKSVTSKNPYNKTKGLQQLITHLIIEDNCWHIEIEQNKQSTLAPKSVNSHVFPLDIGYGKNVSNEVVQEFYRFTEQKTSGGYFPVGANSVWHGGVHLLVPKGRDVRVSFGGKIVAARLSDSDQLAVGHYGSRNFILVKHESKKGLFYSLYMHLNAVPLAVDDPFIKRVSWLGRSLWYRYTGDDKYICRDGVEGNDLGGGIRGNDEFELVEKADKEPWRKIRLKDGSEVFVGIPDKLLEAFYKPKPDPSLLEKLRSGKVVKLDFDVSDDQLLWQSGEYGSDDYRTGLLHWEIFSEDNLFPPVTTGQSNKEESDDAEFVAVAPEKKGTTSGIGARSRRAQYCRSLDGGYI